MPLLSPTLPVSYPETLNQPAERIEKTEKTREINPNAIEVLKAAGVDQRRGKSRMSQLLVDAGLGLEECARKISTFTSYSEDEKIQFDATKLALQLHGELEKEGEKNVGVQINFVGVTPELLQVLIPRG